MQSLSPSQRVVVTGLGVVHALGHDVDTFWASLLAGRCGIQRVTRFDPSNFGCQIGAEVRDWDPAQHMDPKEARRNDRYTHFGGRLYDSFALGGDDFLAVDGDLYRIHSRRLE